MDSTGICIVVSLEKSQVIASFNHENYWIVILFLSIASVMKMSLYCTTKYHASNINLFAVHYAMASFHVTYCESKKIVKMQAGFATEDLKGSIIQTFGLEPNAPMRLQLYDKTWEESMEMTQSSWITVGN